MPDASRDFLGSGWKFPLQVDARGRIALAAREERVAESIALILGTAVGERVMLPDFGCGVHEMVFAPNNTLTQGRVAQAVRRALVAHEARIDVLEVHVESPPGEPNLLLVRVDYRVRANNAFHNLVYPFFLREGG
jgi:phage baseplate assembly protein W